MGKYIVKRLFGLIPTLFVIVTVSFFVIRLAPGSPFATEKAIPVEVRLDLEKKYGFDKPKWEQYLNYMGNLVRGDLGLSTKYPQRTVNEIIFLGLPATMQLGVVALLWSLFIGVGAGMIGAIRQNKIWDHAAMAGAMIGISVPAFVLGPLLMLFFSLYLFWFPPGGWGSWRHLILPGVTLGTVYAAYISRLTRGGLLEVIHADFIRTAKAKGLGERVVLLRHALKGGLLPVVTFLGPAIAALMTGSVVVEKIFSTPGIGPYFVDAAFNRDYFLVMGIVIVDSVFLLLMNLLVDLTYAYLDPRVRYG